MVREPYLVAFRSHPRSSEPLVVYDEAEGISFLLSDSKRPVAGSRNLLTTETKTAQKKETDDSD